MSLFRGFIAVEINPTEYIKEFMQEITKTGADVKLVEIENMHLTIKFLGDTDENHIETIGHMMKKAASAVSPFTITLTGTGVFPNTTYLKVIWIGILNAKPLETIATSLEDQLMALGFQKEKRAFSPHLTIGRVRTAKNNPQLLHAIQTYSSTEFSTQEITSISLKKSELTPQGPIYTTLREVPF